MSSTECKQGARRGLDAIDVVVASPKRYDTDSESGEARTEEEEEGVSNKKRKTTDFYESARFQHTKSATRLSHPNFTFFRGDVCKNDLYVFFFAFLFLYQLAEQVVISVRSIQLISVQDVLNSNH